MFKFALFKKRVFRSLLVSIVFVFFFSSFIIASAVTGVPTIMSYQGRLADASGNLVGSSSGTTYYFKFSVWDMPTGGTASPNRLWPVSDPGVFTTTVRQGVFNVNIGDTASSYPDVLDYNFNTNKNIYLQIEVSSNGSSFETLSPRQRISAVPFAQLSGAVSGTGQSSFGTTTPASNTIVTIQSTTTSSIPLLIRAAASQVADLFKIQDSSLNTLFTVNASGSVGIGTAVPNRKIDVFDVNTNPQLRLSQSISNYGELQADLAGDLSISATGKNIRAKDENLWVCSGGSCDPTIAPAGQGNIVVENAVIFNNKFKFKQTGASTTVMYDALDNPILEFDDGQ